MSDVVMRPHPSTRTKSSSLNGSEIIVGGSIIMPMLMRAAATTRSMTRNGTKTTNPMMNAARSSEMTNAGTSVVSGTSTGVAGFSRSAARVMSARSSSRVWASMNSRSGTAPASSAWLKVVVPSR
ncbi:hypothetical protein IU11_06000 [Cellulosimicrobium sp. MM]|nr:hypothetical protein IU11_06000 [Cellulosimicrobium sp. MM]